MQVIIPYRGGTIDRRAAFRSVADWWHTNFHVWPTVYDSQHSIFNRAASRNMGVQNSRAGIVIVCDADTMPDREAVEAAVDTANDGVMHIPFTTFIQWGREASLAYFMGEDTNLYKPEFTTSDSVGGCMVIDRDAYLSIKGQDEKFGIWGWGGEDTAFAHAADTLLGRSIRHTGVAYGLYHPNDPTRADRYRMNDRRQYEAKYRRARGKPDEMRKLIGL